MKETRSISDRAGAVPGLVVGLLWAAMAATVIWTAMRGAAHGRADWALGWGLVGFFLAAAALSALAGTWWHYRKVKRGKHTRPASRQLQSPSDPSSTSSFQKPSSSASNRAGESR